MTWSKEIPQVSGWYMVIHETFFTGRPRVYQVKELDEEMVIVDEHGTWGIEAYGGCYWYGPIVMPPGFPTD